MEKPFRFTTSDPEHLQESLSPIAGSFRVQSAKGSTFHASVTASLLKKLGLFTVGADSLKVNIEPPLEFFGVNIPLGRPFSALQTNQCHQFYDEFHLVRPDRPMELSAVTDLSVLAVCLYPDDVREYARKLCPSDKRVEEAMLTRLSPATPPGLALMRSLAKLWSACQPRDDTFPSDLCIAELEDEVMTHFVLATKEETDAANRPNAQLTAHAIANIEDYLHSNLTRAVSRADLAEISGVSIRTLSRGFVKRHGLGPMGFLKILRLNATYRDLLGAESSATTVTEIALRYGFNHLGKFASEYKGTFGESPSATLHH